jgi:predicted RNA methylase
MNRPLDRQNNAVNTDEDEGSVGEEEEDEEEEEDFFQIENYYEITFSKNAANAKLIKLNDPNIGKLASELVTSFRQLINAYVKNNNWTKFFDLVDSVDTDLFKNCHATKLLRLGQDEMYRILGDVFFKLDYNLNALEFYRKALKLSSENNLQALESYENLLNLSIERWHYRMVNDRVRNSAYSRAIKKKLEVLREKCGGDKNSIKVLDVGAGTGLLSAQCLDHKIDLEIDNFKLFACEQSELFYKVSEKFLGSFNMNRLLKLFNKHSSDLKKNEDLPVIDLIVTEIFDDGLLGEGCLNTFHNLLFEKSVLNSDRLSLGLSRIIPQSARIYIAAIECEFLHTSNHFRHSFRVYNDVIEVRASCLDNSEKFEKHPNSELNYEPYTTDNLNQVEFSYLTEPVEVRDLFIRFDDRVMLEKLCKRGEVISARNSLQVTNDGALDAFVLWFDLNLDNEIAITNSPLSNEFNQTTKAEISECWQHAIYNVSNDLYVRRGEKLDVNVKMRSDCFLVTPCDPSSQPAASNTSFLNFNLNRVEIALLNNSTYQSFYIDWFEKQVLKKLLSTPRPPEDCFTLKIGFLTSTFNLLFLKLLFEYSHLLRDKHNCSLRVELFINNELDNASSGNSFNFQHYVEQLLKQHPNLRINYLNNEVIFSAQARRGGMYDLDFLIYEPIDVRYGILRKNLMSDLCFVRNNAKNKGSLFLSIIQ